MMSYMITPTPSQIDEQVKLEREAISQGLKRLRDQEIKLENQNYASATIYGVASIHSLLPKLIERIEVLEERQSDISYFLENPRKLNIY